MLRARRLYYRIRYHEFYYCLRFFHILIALYFLFNISDLLNPAYLAASVALGVFLSFWGFNITAHRLVAHQGFEASKPTIAFLYLTYFMSSMTSPLFWNVLHRLHHIYSDTKKDPHSPKHLGAMTIFWKIFFAYFPDVTIGFNHIRKTVGVDHIRTGHRWGFEILLAMNLLVFLFFGVSGLFYIIVLPSILVALNIWVQAVPAHNKEEINSGTRDFSMDSFLLGLLTVGDGYHGSHHRYPNVVYHRRKPGAFPDVPGWVVSRFFKPKGKKYGVELRYLTEDDTHQIMRINSQHEKLMGIKKYEDYDRVFASNVEKFFKADNRYFFGAFHGGELHSYIGIAQWPDFPFFTIAAVKAARETHLFDNQKNNLIDLTSYVMTKEMERGCVGYWFLTSRQHHRGSVKRWRNATPELADFKFISRTIEKNYRPEHHLIYRLMGERVWNEDLVIRVGIKKGHESAIEKFHTMLDITDASLENEDNLKTIYC